MDGQLQAPLWFRATRGQPVTSVYTSMPPTTSLPTASQAHVPGLQSMEDRVLTVNPK